LFLPLAQKLCGYVLIVCESKEEEKRRDIPARCLFGHGLEGALRNVCALTGQCKRCGRCVMRLTPVVQNRSPPSESAR